MIKGGLGFRQLPRRAAAGTRAGKRIRRVCHGGVDAAAAADSRR